tara:strand:+ start:3644 stop:3847 length:204 start_codon:yes stop_codon:yes gene_type:complete
MKTVLIIRNVRFEGRHYDINRREMFETDDANLLISKGKAREDLTPLTAKEAFDAEQAADNSVDYDLP